MLSVALLLAAALVGAAAALAIRSAFTGGGHPAASPPADSPPALEQLLLKSDDGRTLNDAAFYLIGAHQYKRALPLARRAVRKAASGTDTKAYATFNLGLTLLELGRCRESLVYLRRAQQIEPADQQPYIRPKVKQAERCVQRAASAQAQSASSAARTGPSQAP